jgi:hypothetical protein
MAASRSNKSYRPSRSSKTSIVGETQSTASIFGIIFSAIVLYFIYRAYNYLNSLGECSCVDYKNIPIIKNLELLYIILILIGLALNAYALFTKQPVFNITKYFGVAVIYLVILAITYIVFIYNVYQLWMSNPEKCSCANKWPLDIIYIQAIWYLIPYLVILFGLIYGLGSIAIFIIVIIAGIYAIWAYNYKPSVVKQDLQKKTPPSVTNAGYHHPSVVVVEGIDKKDHIVDLKNPSMTASIYPFLSESSSMTNNQYLA